MLDYLQWNLVVGIGKRDFEGVPRPKYGQYYKFGLGKRAVADYLEERRSEKRPDSVRKFNQGNIVEQSSST